VYFRTQRREFSRMASITQGAVYRIHVPPAKMLYFFLDVFNSTRLSSRSRSNCAVFLFSAVAFLLFADAFSTSIFYLTQDAAT
jgi:hypothetical protein